MASISNNLVTDFLSKHGDFKVYGSSTNIMVYHGVDALNKLHYWHWIKCFDPNRGFVLSEHKNVTKIFEELSKDDHTGITFACLMRLLQKMSKDLVEGDGIDEVCPICCSDEYSGNKTTLECGHMFHYGCSEKWFNSGPGKTCPTCRKNTLPDYVEREEKEARI